jgi:hypothetical protein
VTNLAEAAAAMLVAVAMLSGGGGDVGNGFSWAKLAGGSVASLSRRGASFWLRTTMVSKSMLEYALRLTFLITLYTSLIAKRRIVRCPLFL